MVEKTIVKGDDAEYTVFGKLAENYASRGTFAIDAWRLSIDRSRVKSRSDGGKLCHAYTFLDKRLESCLHNIHSSHEVAPS